MYSHRLSRKFSWLELGKFVASLLLLVVVACKGPSGDRGPQGEKGDPGAQGGQGVTGDQGDVGANGRDAASCVVMPGESIQACVDSVLANNGGTVQLRAGTHRLTSYVHIHGDNLVLQGEGTATILYLADGADASPILIGGDPALVNPDTETGAQPVRHVTILNVLIDVNGAKQTGEKWASYPHISISGITIRFAEDVTIRGVLVTHSPSAGILVEKSTTGFLLDAVELRESTYDGFSCNKSYQGQVVNSRLNDNVHAGITATCDCSDNVFTDNMIVGNGVGITAPGIYFAEANRNLVADNLIDGNSDTGITLHGADCGVTTTGAADNYFAQNRITDNQSCAVYLDLSGSGPGLNNVALGSFYEGNGYNGVCNLTSSLYDDRNPIVVSP